MTCGLVLLSLSGRTLSTLGARCVEATNRPRRTDFRGPPLLTNCFLPSIFSVELQAISVRSLTKAGKICHESPWCEIQVWVQALKLKKDFKINFKFKNIQFQSSNSKWIWEITISDPVGVILEQHLSTTTSHLLFGGLGSRTPQSLARQRGTSVVTKEISAAKARPTRWSCDLTKDHLLCPCSSFQDLKFWCSELKSQVTTKYLKDTRNGCTRLQIWLPLDEDTPIHLYDRTGTHARYGSLFQIPFI